ncbi:hypothetical protein ANANG_G00045370 [Anguilla anguilla]|uniref:PX domain-containing protein n=1 Tax=Anguilla anguilla TaxID=7936 RepID=A0A9D3MXF5_ANGAN|nr:hypothetical protein ANANG_G00045370 [Anguilla anguilla]
MNEILEEDEFIAVRVQDPRVQNEGFWNSYVDFKIFLHTNSKAFTAKTSCVRRRYSEFVWLKKKLQKNSGVVPVPGLPGKTLFFSFGNEDFIERRRRGLQNFLDKVVHMTVCLSDSQLHLFLQTQLPVRHIEDCVQGHTPYSVTDAILTYASSNRGWAQEEEGVVQEPSLPSVSYESVDSPAPHLPSLQNEENFDIRASVAETHKMDFQETYSHKAASAMVGAMKEETVCEEDVHQEGAQEVNTCVTEARMGTIQEKDASEEPVYQTHAYEHESKPDAQDSDTFKVTPADAHEENVNEVVYESSAHEVNICVIEGAETSCKEKHTYEEELSNHETSNCVIGGKENPMKEKTCEKVHDVVVYVSNVCVIGETGDSAKEMDSNHTGVYEVAANESNISMNRAMEITVEEDTNEIAYETSASRANYHESESNSDSKSDAEDTDTIVAPSDTHGVDTSEDVHMTDAYIASTGTTDADVCEHDCVVLGDSDDIQEKPSYDTKEDDDAKYSITSVIGASKVEEGEANISDMHINNMFGASEAGVHESIQDPDSKAIVPETFVFRLGETIIHKLDDCKADVPETDNQELGAHEMDNHTDFNGQPENCL